MSLTENSNQLFLPRGCNRTQNLRFGPKTKCGKSDFSYLKELFLKERIRSLWEQILSFKKSSHFKKGRNCSSNHCLKILLLN